MPRAPRRHGTRSCYNQGCHRPECEQANREYKQAYTELARRYRRPKRIDPARTVEHIASLHAAGMSYEEIATAAGMKRQNVWQVADGCRKTILPRTEQRILNVTLHLERRIDATGTRRRIQALAALGYTLSHIEEHAGVVSRVMVDVISGQPTVYRTTADAITATYDQWSMTPGPSELARARAAAKGWAPALAWDDDTIDDPNAEPVGALVARPAHLGKPASVRREGLDLDEWLRLMRYGEIPERAAERCGVKLGSVEWSFRRHGRSAEYVAAMERSRERSVA